MILETDRTGTSCFKATSLELAATGRDSHCSTCRGVWSASASCRAVYRFRADAGAGVVRSSIRRDVLAQSHEDIPIPEDAFYMAGAGGQSSIIIPTHDMTVVRLGHYKGAEAGDAALGRSLALLMQAVPQVRAAWQPH